jgi:toxin ParE1/3/4
VARIFRGPRAEQDLIDIWTETFRRWGVEQADHYADALIDAIEGLAEFPERGPSCDWIRRGYRRSVVRHHCVFYRVEAEAVEIVRVLHERMDWDDHL